MECCRVAVNCIQIPASHLNDKLVSSIGAFCDFNLVCYTVFEIASKRIIIVVGNADYRSNTTQISVIAAMLIGKRRNEFLVNSGEAGEVFDKDRQGFLPCFFKSRLS